MVVGAFPLAGKIAVVTGAGSGINLSFTKMAVSQGARVVIADIALTEDAKTFTEENEDSVVFVQCDVTKRSDLENTVVQAETRFGDAPDVYIAGAGVFEPEWSNFWDDSEEDGYKEIDINVTHPLKLSRIAIKSLVKHKKPGVVLIVGSRAGYVGNFGAALYCATKHAVVGFVRSVAYLDKLQDIKVVLVAPSFVHTPLWTLYPEKINQFGYDISKAVMPEEVADAMINLITKGEYGGGSCMRLAVGQRQTLAESQDETLSKADLELSYKTVLEKIRDV